MTQTLELPEKDYKYFQSIKEKFDIMSEQMEECVEKYKESIQK